MKLLITDTFPTIEVTTTQGAITLPDEYAGHWFVFFNHPGDFTPVCTTEFVGFQKRAEQFAGLDTKLIGLSVDDIGQHHAWITWIQDHLEVGVEFPIIDDLMTPANWANNENMGDLVLVPPSMELTAAQVAEQHVTHLSDRFRYHRASA